MAVSDHTFSFRAPAALAERLQRAERAYAELAGDATLAAHISRELEVGLQRRLRAAPEHRGGQAHTLRAVAEAFVDAAESAAHDEGRAAELRVFYAEDRAGPAERAGLLGL